MNLLNKVFFAAEMINVRMMLIITTESPIINPIT